MNFETIKFELKENGIGILTLNRPDKLNAMSFQLTLLFKCLGNLKEKNREVLHLLCI